MSDSTPDPIDAAYVRAEALLEDEAARAERRARVLAAVAEESAATGAAASPPLRKAAWRRGGWLAAACVATLSVFLTLRLQPVPPLRPETAPQSSGAPPDEAVDAAGARPAAEPQDAAPSTPSASVAAPSVSRAAPGLRVPAQPPPTLSSPPFAAASAPAPAMQRAAPSAPPPPSETQDMTVSGQGRPAAEAAASARVGRAAGSSAERPPSDRVARLHAAAAAGRNSEVAALLSRGVPVDATDPDGETALMKALRSGHADTAALLRRHGANLDAENAAGVSARDLAEALDEERRGEALGASGQERN